MSTRDLESASEAPGAKSPKATLTRQDIALALHQRLGNISHREAKRLTDFVIDEMFKTLTSGETLKLHDFGSFVVRSKHERAGRNPRTGEAVPIEARRVVVFKPSPNMKAVVNGDTRSDTKPAKRGKSSKDGSGGGKKKSRRTPPAPGIKAADEAFHELRGAVIG